MRNLLTFFLIRPIATLMLILLILMAGVYSLKSLPQEFYPELTPPVMTVSASLGSTTTEDMKTLVTIPLEEALSSLQGLETIESITRPGSVLITLTLQWGVDMVNASIKTREIIDRSYTVLPARMQKPNVMMINPNQHPLLTLGIVPIDSTLPDLSRMAREEISTELKQVPGVGSIIIVGGREEELKVLVDRNRLEGLGWDLSTLIESITSMNLSHPSGILTEGKIDYLIKTDGESRTLAELKTLMVPLRDGLSIPLSELACLNWELSEQESYFSVNGQEAIGVIIRRREGVNPIVVSRDILNCIETLQKRWNNEFKIVVLQDHSELIKKNIRSLSTSLLMGMGLSFLIFLIFSNRWSQALSILLSIPLTIALSFISLALLGRSLNIMSLGGLVMAIGMIVDNSVVILENINHREAATIDEVVSAVLEMTKSILGSTITSIIIFLPLFFMPSLIGELYRDLALSVSLSLIFSLIVSMIFPPWAFLFLQNGKEFVKPQRKRFKLKIQFKLLKHPLIGIGTIILLTLLPLPLITRLELNLFEDIPQGGWLLEISHPPGTSLEFLKTQERTIINNLHDFLGPSNITGRIGGSENDIYYRSDPEQSASKITISFNGSEDREFLEKLCSTHYVNYKLTPWKEPLSVLLGINKAGTILIESEDRSLCGETSLFSPNEPLEEIVLYPRRDRMSNLQIDMDMISSSLTESLEGIYRGTMEKEGVDYPIHYQYDNINREAIQKIKVLSPQGSFISMSELTSMKRVIQAGKLLRVNGKDALWLINQDDIQTLNDSVRVIQSQGTLFERYQKEIIQNLILGVILLYLYLGIQFESFLQPVIILLILPLSTIYGLTLLAFLGKSLNIQTAMGILILFGIAVNNGILLIDGIHRETSKGFPLSWGILLSVKKRLRTMTITTLTTIMAIIPLGIKTSAGQGMALVVMGGLFSSFLLTLYLLPPIILIISKKK